MPRTQVNSKLSVGDILELIVPGLWHDYRLLLWPPDVFAVAVSVLQRSGGYTTVLENWPPAPVDATGTPRRAAKNQKMPTPLEAWAAWIRNIGAEWGKTAAPAFHARTVVGIDDMAADLQLSKLPWLRVLKSWWDQIRDAKDFPVFDDLSPQRISLFQALLQLCAAADEACYGVGQPRPDTPMQEAANVRLQEPLTVHGPPGVQAERPPFTLGWQVDPSRGLILPKLHSPQSGLTVRALTHHLAFCPATEITPLWYVNHQSIPEHSVNLLVLPWPTEVSPAQFRACGQEEVEFHIAGKFGHFTYQPLLPENWQQKLVQVLRAALRQAGEIDGVVLPELTLPDEDAYFELVRLVLQELQNVSVLDRLQVRRTVASVLIVAGVGSGPDRAGRATKNKAMCSLHLWRPAGEGGGFWIPSEFMEQSKQHSWKLDASQISNYSLGKQLDISKSWWEHNKLGSRDIVFVAWAAWLTLCTVICEDLARPDPLTEMVRVVGPNLVIALLMDGPQLPQRWSGRYATVLADDPGSAVLTLTSIGMVERSTPPGKEPSRVVALWKDPLHGVVELSLPRNAEALVLTLTRVATTEWTADGRNDRASSACLTLSGVLPIRAEAAGAGKVSPVQPAGVPEANPLVARP